MRLEDSVDTASLRSEQRAIAGEIVASRAAIACQRASALCESASELRWLRVELFKTTRSLLREIHEIRPPD